MEESEKDNTHMYVDEKIVKILKYKIIVKVLHGTPTPVKLIK